MIGLKIKIRDTKPVSVTLHFSAAHRLKFQVLQWDGVAIALSQDQLSFRNSSRTWKVQGSDKRLCHEAHKDFRDQGSTNIDFHLFVTTFFIIVIVVLKNQFQNYYCVAKVMNQVCALQLNALDELCY